MSVPYWFYLGLGSGITDISHRNEQKVTELTIPSDLNHRGFTGVGRYSLLSATFNQEERHHSAQHSDLNNRKNGHHSAHHSGLKPGGKKHHSAHHSGLETGEWAPLCASFRLKPREGERCLRRGVYPPWERGRAYTPGYYLPTMVPYLPGYIPPYVHPCIPLCTPLYTTLCTPSPVYLPMYISVYHPMYPCIPRVHHAYPRTWTGVHCGHAGPRCYWEEALGSTLGIIKEREALRLLLTLRVLTIEGGFCALLLRSSREINRIDWIDEG